MTCYLAAWKSIHNLLNVLHDMLCMTLGASCCVSGRALVVVGYGLLLCLLPVRGLKVGNILVLHPAVLAVPGVVLVLLAQFVPVSLLTLFLAGTAQILCRPQCLGVQFFAIQDVDLFWDPRISRVEVKWNTQDGRQVDHKALGHENAPRLVASAGPDLEAGMADRPLPRSVPSPPLVNKYSISFMSAARTPRNTNLAHDPPLTNLAHEAQCPKIVILYHYGKLRPEWFAWLFCAWRTCCPMLQGWNSCRCLDHRLCRRIMINHNKKNVMIDPNNGSDPVI